MAAAHPELLNETSQEEGSEMPHEATHGLKRWKARGPVSGLFVRLLCRVGLHSRPSYPVGWDLWMSDPCRRCGR